MNFIRLICLVCIMGGACSVAHAQDWKSILTGVANTIGNKVNTSDINLVGTWQYVNPDCKFESDNLLAKAGGEVAAKKVEEKMSEVFTKLGFTDGCTYVFNADSTYTSTVKGRTTEGTYTYDASSKSLTMKTRLGVKFTANVSRNLTGDKMSLLFKADKLMNLVQSVGSFVGKNSSDATLNSVISLLDEYEGLQLGFELKSL